MHNRHGMLKSMIEHIVPVKDMIKLLIKIRINPTFL